MNHRAQVRAAQEHLLRDSLAGSSLSFLTVVVAAVLAGVSLRADVPIPDDVIEIPLHEVGDVIPLPDPPSGGGGGGEVPAVPSVLAVDGDERDTLITADPFPPSDPAPGGGGGEGPPGSFPGAGDGDGATGPGEAIPAPDVYIVHDELPEIAYRVEPEYPGALRDAGIEGRVRVRIFIGVDGRVKRAEIEGRPSAFDEAALAAIRQWVFTPAKANGRPVAVWMRVPVVFGLD